MNVIYLLIMIGIVKYKRKKKNLIIQDRLLMIVRINNLVNLLLKFKNKKTQHLQKRIQNLNNQLRLDL